MGTLILQRTIDAVIVLLIVSLVAFLILHLSGDPVLLMVDPSAPPEQRDEIRHMLGLDRPLHEQYLQFLINATRGDLGKSLHYGSPTLPIALERMPATAELAFRATAIALAIGIPAGVLSAVFRNRPLDYAVRIFAFLGQSIPFFWLAIMMILLFSVRLELLPTSGRGSWSQLIMPSLVLSALPLARTTRLIRSSMLSVLQDEYITVARAKGLPRVRVITVHALKNAMLPVVTDISLLLGMLLNGAMITETIFGWPGIGRLMIDSIATRDYPMVQALVMINALIFVTLNLAADIWYPLLDPRVRYDQ